MNDEFNKRYLALLRKQVEEEIQYLVTNGHDQGVIYNNPCMFCIERQPDKYAGPDKYICRRLIDLRQFLSSIITRGAPQLHARQERKRIGFETESLSNIECPIPSYSSALPLLSIKL